MRIRFDNCPICDSSKKEEIIRFNNSMQFINNKFYPFDLHKSLCMGCGHIYSDIYNFPMNLDDYYESARDSDENLIYNKSEDLNETFMNLVDWFVETTGVNHDAIKNILDIGCGKCDLLGSFGAVFNNAVLYGLDFSPQARLFGIDKGIKNIVIGDFYDQIFNGKQFNIISATGVIEHQVDLSRFMEKIVSISQKGTYLLIEVPDSISILKNRDDLRAKFMHDICNNEHFHHFNPYSLIKYLERFGFVSMGSRKISRGNWDDINIILKYKYDGISIIKDTHIKKEYYSNLKAVYLAKKGKYRERIQSLVKTAKKLGVYGAGWHTTAVLPTFYEMEFNNVKMIFDQDPRKVGQSIFNTQIEFPTKEKMEEVDAILISSINMEESIYNYLVNTGISQNKIIRLYEEA